MFRAKGIKNGKRTEVTVEKFRGFWEFRFNGEDDLKLEEEILDKMQVARPFAGMRIPENEEQRIASVLEGYFFDRAPEEIEVPFELEEIPDDGGVF